MSCMTVPLPHASYECPLGGTKQMRICLRYSLPCGRLHTIVFASRVTCGNPSIGDSAKVAP